MKENHAARKTEEVAMDVTAIRQKTGLSQRNFSLLIGISFRTL
jgi:DNA-binding transcriptional regulator YiaG